MNSYANFKEKLTCSLKKDLRNWQSFTRALESVKIWTLMGSFCPNYKRYDIKNYRGVICYDNEE